MTIQSVPARWLAGGFALLASVFCFLHLSHPDVQQWDESENARVIYDTLESGNPWVLVLDDRVFFDKPAMWYYLTEIAVALFGSNELAWRLVSATAGLVLILTVYFFAIRRFSPAAGLAAGMFMLAVTQLYIPRPGGVFSTHNLRSADSDALMICLMFAAFVCFGEAVSGKRWGLSLGAALTALAVLAKGPLGFAAATAFVAFQLLSPERVRIRIRDAVLAACVFLALAVPWHLGMYLGFGETFLDLYPRYVWFRFTTGIEVHTPPESFYYLRVLTNRRVFFGIELVAIAAIAVATDRGRLRRYSHSATLLAFGIMFTSLMMAKTKIAWYLLPLYPFAALLVAGLVDRLRRAALQSAPGGLVWASRCGLVAVFLALILAGSYNLRQIVLLRRGPVQTFFERALESCPDVVYADEREDLFRLRRYSIARGTAKDASCFITRTDTPVTSNMAGSARILEGGGFVLWRRP